jgi:hypothetical protein
MKDKLEELFDPFALGGWAEEDEQARELLQCFPSSKTERQGNLFRFVLEAMQRSVDEVMKERLITSLPPKAQKRLDGGWI